jgi:lysozyme
MINSDDLVDILIRHEGLLLKPYRCTAGKLTIGVGRNLDDVGISEQEALAMLRSDIAKAKIALIKDPQWPLAELDTVRQMVLVNMCFQLGKRRLDGFKKFRAAVVDHDWQEAAVQMKDSRWYRQTTKRADELIEMMKTGVYASP